MDQIYATPSDVQAINKEINEAMGWVWRGWGLYQMWEGAL